jgi:DNA invertase Pin-like site-specific DNA recombinase
MSLPAATATDKIHGRHRDRLAVVYVRQSTLQQVGRHPESTRLQYALAERAQRLGWARERVVVIDDDLGRSGTSAEVRPGFQRLVAEVGLGRVGLVLGAEVSRLARSCRDWHQLLEICALFDTLIADGDGVLDPAAYNDRLLLGLKGTMSEAELHILKGRMQAGRDAKARRGELSFNLPRGYVRRPSGEVALDPDEQAQAVVRLVFDLFDQRRTINGVLVHLVAHDVRLPNRLRGGPAKGELVWRRPNRHTLGEMLTNPAYAGAYAYGRRAIDPRRRRPGYPGSGRIKREPGAMVLLRDRWPAYISWQDHERDCAQVTANRARHTGVPRGGPSLLAGLLVCGRCGRRMATFYPQGGHYLRYGCGREAVDYGAAACQSLSGRCLDALVGGLIVQALAPAAVEASLQLAEDVELERTALQRQWRQRLERARYEAERARRQYDAVEPENRLVARSLERAWEERLRTVEQVEEEYECWRREQPLALDAAERAEILAVGEDIAAVWFAPTTAPGERKRIVRLVIQEVVLDQKRVAGQVCIRIVWQTGAVSEHRLRRRVQGYDDHADLDQLEQRVRTLNAEGRMDGEVAEVLNAEGFVSAHGTAFDHGLVHLLRKRWDIPTVKINGVEPNPARWPDGSYSVQGAAQALGITVQTVFKWLKRGWLSGHQLARGMPWQVTLEDARLPELRALAQRNRPSRRKVL